MQGFRKTDPERWEFTNEHFQKGRRDLLGSIVRRKPAGATKAEHHDLDDDLADDRSERSNLPSVSPRQPINKFAMQSPRDEFPPGRLPPLEHYQAAGMPRRGSFSGNPTDVLQSPQEASAAATHDAHQANLASARGFSSFHWLSAETGHGNSDPTSGARGDVDMLAGRKPGSAGASSAFAAPAGQAMCPPLAGRQPQQAGPGTGQMAQSHGSDGIEGMQRFTRLVDNVMGGSGSSHATNEHGGSNRTSAPPASHAVSNLSNGSAPPPPSQRQQPQLQRSGDSHSRHAPSHSAERTSGSAGRPVSTGSPDGEYGQADMEDATVKKRKYRRSTERRQPMDQSGKPSRSWDCSHLCIAGALVKSQH